MKEKIFQKIELHDGLTFETIISGSFELFKKVFAYGILKVIFEIILIYIIYFALIIPMIPLFIGLENQNSGSSAGMSGLTGILMGLVYFLIGSLAIFVSFCLTVGFYRVCFQQESGLNVNIEAFFYALKKKYWMKTFLLSMLLSFVIGISHLLFLLPGIYMLIPMGFIPVVYAFNIDLSIRDVFSVAFKLGNKYWLLMFLSSIVAVFISFLGYFACIIGILATQSFIYMPFYTTYSKVVGFDTDIASEIDLIGENKEEL